MTAASGRYRYRIRYSITGRIRFLSHLETVDTLLGSVRRAGYEPALSQGMKPKPRISIAMPRPVAVEGLGELVEVELTTQPTPEQLHADLAGTLPAGIVIELVEEVPTGRRYVAGAVTGARYLLLLDAPGDGGPDPEQLAGIVERFAASDELVVARRTPSQHRDVNVAALVEDMHVAEVPAGAAARGWPTAAAIGFYLPLADGGSARPSEVVTALERLAGHDLGMPRIVRLEVHTSDDGGREATVELVGAGVEPGPARPWGSC